MNIQLPRTFALSGCSRHWPMPIKIVVVWALAALSVVVGTQSSAQWDVASCEKGASYMRESTKEGEFAWAATTTDAMVLSNPAFRSLGNVVLDLVLHEYSVVDGIGDKLTHLDARCVGKSNDEKVVTKKAITVYTNKEGGYKTVKTNTPTCNQLNLARLQPWVQSGFAGTNSCDAQIILLNIAVQMDAVNGIGESHSQDDCYRRGNAGSRIYETGKTCLEYAEQPQPEGSFAAYLAAHFSAINNEAVKAKEVQDAAILQAALEEAAKKKAADDAVSRFLACDDCRTEYKLENVNTQTYVDANGNKGTLWCNPGPCESGSSLKHGFVTGVGTLMPLKLVEDVTKTLGEPLTKEIFNITKDALLASAETSDDPKLKSAAAMTTEQIKSKQVANEKSQEDKSGNLVVESPAEEAPAEEAPAEEAPAEETLVEETPVEEAPAAEAPVEEAPVEEAPVDEGTEAPVEEWDDDCAGMDQCNIPIEGVDF